MAEVRAKLAPGTPIEVWCQDEMRVGQKNKLTYRWARKGSRPRAVHDQRTQSTYLFGAVCPELGTGAALVLPACNSEAMQLHLCSAFVQLVFANDDFAASTKRRDGSAEYTRLSWRREMV